MKKFYFYSLSCTDSPENIKYIGVTTTSIVKRFSQHKYCANHSEKRGLPVHKWMYSKYLKGYDIIIKQIDMCLENEWENKEQYLIQYYRNLGYDLLNVDKGGRGVITKEKRQLSSIERSIKGHEIAIVALNKDGSFFKEFESSIKAAKFLNLKSDTAIRNATNGWSKSCSGYLWVKKSEYNPNNNYCYSIKEIKQVKVYEFNLEGELIKVWNKISDFDKISGYSQNGLRKAIIDKKPYHNSYFSFFSSINIIEYKPPFKFKLIIDNCIHYCKSQREMAKILKISESQLSIKLKSSNIINGSIVEKI